MKRTFTISETMDFDGHVYVEDIPCTFRVTRHETSDDGGIYTAILLSARIGNMILSRRQAINAFGDEAIDGVETAIEENLEGRVAA